MQVKQMLQKIKESVVNLFVDSLWFSFAMGFVFLVSSIVTKSDYQHIIGTIWIGVALVIVEIRRKV